MEWIKIGIQVGLALVAIGTVLFGISLLWEIKPNRRKGLPEPDYIPPRPPRGAFAPKRADNEPPLPPRERYFKNEAEIKGEALQRVYEREDMIDYIIKYSPEFAAMGYSAAYRDLNQRSDNFIENLAGILWRNNKNEAQNQHGKEETSR
ncbi:hypothetical protein [Larkinella ripae]